MAKIVIIVCVLIVVAVVLADSGLVNFVAAHASNTAGLIGR